MERGDYLSKVEGVNNEQTIQLDGYLVCGKESIKPEALPRCAAVRRCGVKRTESPWDPGSPLAPG